MATEVQGALPAEVTAEEKPKDEPRRSIRPKTQIEILAEKERERQQKKADKKEARAAKAAAKREEEELKQTGGKKNLTKKERKKLEAEF